MKQANAGMAMFAYLSSSYSGTFLSSDQSMVFTVDMVRVKFSQALDTPKGVIKQNEIYTI